LIPLPILAANALLKRENDGRKLLFAFAGVSFGFELFPLGELGAGVPPGAGFMVFGFPFAGLAVAGVAGGFEGLIGEVGSVFPEGTLPG
jgi:hypothetical protein